MASNEIPQQMAQQGFRALNQVVTPLVRAGVGSPFPFAGGGVVLLETKGRKSGQIRTVPLLGFRAGSKVVVTTVRGDSQWFKNLEADASASIWLNGRRYPATASLERGALNVATLEIGDAE